MLLLPHKCMAEFYWPFLSSFSVMQYTVKGMGVAKSQCDVLLSLFSLPFLPCCHLLPRTLARRLTLESFLKSIFGIMCYYSLSTSNQIHICVTKIPMFSPSLLPFVSFPSIYLDCKRFIKVTCLLCIWALDIVMKEGRKFGCLEM